MRMNDPRGPVFMDKCKSVISGKLNDKNSPEVYSRPTSYLLITHISFTMMSKVYEVVIAFFYKLIKFHK
jgi:hypothetical protein